MKSKYFILSKMVKITCLVGIVFAMVVNFDINLIIRSFNSNIILNIFEGQVFLFLGTLAAAYRYAILVNTPSLSLKNAFMSLVLSFGFNYVLPARMSEMVRPLYLKKYLNIPLSKTVSALFLERISDIIILCNLVIFGAGVVLNINKITYISLLLLLVLLVLLLPYTETYFIKMLAFIKFKKIAVFLQNIIIHLTNCIKARLFYKAIMAGCVSWFFSYSMVFIFLNNVGSIPIDFAGCLLVFIAIMIGGAIPGLPGGIGTYEGAAVFSLHLLGYGIDESLIIAIGLHIAQMLMGVVGVVTVLFSNHINLDEWFQETKMMFKDSGKDE